MRRWWGKIKENWLPITIVAVGVFPVLLIIWPQLEKQIESFQYRQKVQTFMSTVKIGDDKSEVMNMMQDSDIHSFPPGANDQTENLKIWVPRILGGDTFDVYKIEFNDQGKVKAMGKESGWSFFD